jgi:hypothetical protein
MTWKVKNILEYVKRRPKKIIETRDTIALEPIPFVCSCYLVVSEGLINLSERTDR